MNHPHLTSPRRGCAVVAAAASLLAVVTSPVSAADGVVPFRSGAVVMEATTAERTTTDLADLATRPGGARHLLVRLDRTPGEADRATLEAEGLTVLRSLGGGVFFASLNERFANAGRLAGIGRIKSVAEIAPEWKLHPSLNGGEIPAWAAAVPADDSEALNPWVAVYVLFHPDVELVPDALAVAGMHGALVRSRLESVNGLVLEIKHSMIGQLALADSVQYIEPALPPFKELNNSNRARVGADVAQDAPYSLDGSGVVVMVFDGGGAFPHADFGGRLTQRDTDGLSDHSTHVAGTIGGDGSESGGLYKGMAPGVTIESYGFEVEGGLVQGFLYTDPGDLEADYDDAINSWGAVMANNSIGTNTAPNGFPCEWEGDYGVTSAPIDSIVRGSLGAPMRIVWANGNERQGSAPCGSTYHTTAPPACAKNHITVGALNSNDDTMTDFSSWGPADDGRLKPDVSGPGCQSDDDQDVTSCSNGGGYSQKCGTSMSAPTVCGVGALILQDFRIQNPSEPDFLPSTLKVLLAHSAEDLGNAGPDYQFGYGSVRAVSAIDLMRSGNFLEGEVANGQVISVLVSVNPGDTELKVTLAWDDVPGTPNVDPALVNDLDLAVFNDGGTQFFPWTLDPANPGTPAVQTDADHLNNIEQVFIANPPPGIYRIDISGFSIAEGPQAYSLAAEPLLINCSSRGLVSLDKVIYPCESPATIKIVDCDLNTDDGVVETVMATIVSDSEPGGESILLTESGPETAEFSASFSVSAADAVGTLLVAHGDTVTATYIDADDGEGSQNVVVNYGSPVDCQAPGVTSVQAIDVAARDAKVEILTDELVQATVRYGTSCGALFDDAGSGQFRDDHLISLSGLSENTVYFYEVELTDQAGNAVIDDNGGACYSFETPDVPDNFTEEFGGSNDLDGYSVTYTPGNPADFYTACEEQITELPVSPSGTPIALTDDDTEEIPIGLGLTVSLYGTDWSSFYVGSNGYVTFGGGDTDYTESLGDHFSQPRISGLFDDLNPSAGGTVYWRQLGDRMVVTWDQVPEFSTSNSNTFQIEMFFDGTIRTSWLGIAVTDGLSGLSEGLGVPPAFIESDLTNPGCNGPGIPGDANGDGTVNVDDLNEIIIAWGDCPDDPAPCPADVNGDGVVNVDDLVLVVTFWGTSGLEEMPAAGVGSVTASVSNRAGYDAGLEAAREIKPTPPLPPMYVNADLLAPAEHDGVFTTAGGYRQTHVATLAIDVAGDAPVAGHDLLAIRGPAMLDGTLSVRFVGETLPAAGTRFPVLAARTISGVFGTVQVEPADLPVEVVYGTSTVTLVVGGTPAADATAGDANDAPPVTDVNGDDGVCVADVFQLLDTRTEDGDFAADLAAVLRALP